MGCGGLRGAAAPGSAGRLQLPVLPALSVLPVPWGSGLPWQWGTSHGGPRETRASGPEKSKKVVKTHADKQQQGLGLVFCSTKPETKSLLKFGGLLPAHSVLLSCGSDV